MKLGGKVDVCFCEVLHQYRVRKLNKKRAKKETNRSDQMTESGEKILVVIPLGRPGGRQNEKPCQEWERG